MQAKSLPEPEILQNLRKFLRLSGLKQVDLAKLMAVSPVTVNRWLSGERRIGDKVLNEMAAHLNVTVSQITGTAKEEIPLTAKHEPSLEEWKQRALIAEAKLKHLQEACSALGQHVSALGSTVGQHVSALGSTVESFSRIISE